MLTKTTEKAEQLKETLSDQELSRMNFRLSDAIREGSTVTEHNTRGWGDGESACALHAGIISAKARGFLE